MGIINQIKSWIGVNNNEVTQELIQDVQLNKSTAGVPAKKRVPLSRRAKSTTSASQLRINALESAIYQAENKDNPSRKLLYALYKKAMRTDAQVITVTKTRRNRALSNAFVVFDKSKKIGNRFSEDKHTLLNKTWFHNFLKFALDSDFFGISLIELGDIDKNGEFANVELIPRESVVPETKKVVIQDEGGKEILIDYDSEEFAPWLIEVVNQEERLGWLVVALRFSIFKNFSISDWSRRSEKYGMPIMAVESDITSDEELDEIESAMRNLGSDGFVILPNGTKASLLEPDGNGGHSIYDAMADKMDGYISKLFLGQTMTTDDGSSYAQADVHADILDDYTRADLVFLRRIVNDQLIPKLIAFGYPLEGFEFDFYVLTDEYKQAKTAEKEKEHDGSDRDMDVKKTTKNNVAENGVGKPLATIELPSITTDASVVVANKQDVVDLDEVVNTVVQAIFDEKIQAGDVSPALAQAQMKHLYKAIGEGYGKVQSEMKANDADIVRQLKYNTRVFSVFKTHAQVNDVVAQLVDENGKRRSYEDFKKAVEPITETYNQAWLRTEYDTATACARSAADWQTFVAEKELYPYVRYETVGDGRVRPEHAALDGMTVSVDSPLLDTYATPNGVKCRCYWIQVANGPESIPKVLPDVPPNFRNNPGKSGKIWVDMGTYEDGIARQKRDALDVIADVFLPNTSFQSIRNRVLEYGKKHILNVKYTTDKVTGGSFAIRSMKQLKSLIFSDISILMPNGQKRPAGNDKMYALLFLNEIVSRISKAETTDGVTTLYSSVGAYVAVMVVKLDALNRAYLAGLMLHHPKVLK